MVNKMDMTLTQLREYRAWIESDRDIFKANYPKAHKDATNARMRWYARELNRVDSWIKFNKDMEVRRSMENKANRFLNPPSAQIKKASPLDILRMRIKDFFYNIFGGPRG